MGDPGVGFVLLALRLDRLSPGLIDSYWADPALRARVAAEPRHDPRVLADDAAILFDRVKGADLGPQRKRSLAVRTRALRAFALRLAGQGGSWLDEVEISFGVRPELADPKRYLDAQQRLAAVLPGPAPLTERYAAYRRAMTCPPARAREAVTALSVALRARTLAITELPAGDAVDWQFAEGAAWAGACSHDGGGHSTVSVDLSGPVRLASLPGLVAHEAYPGHHTQGCRADLARVAQGWVEHAVTVVASPDCTVAEGAAEHALSMAVGGGWGSFAREVYRGIAIDFDGTLAAEVAAAVGALEDVRLDAAYLLHELQRPEAEVRAHLAAYGLLTPDRVDQAMAFVQHPIWRHYVATYGEGGRLVAAWLDAGGDRVARYARLLDEPLLPSDLAQELFTPPSPEVARVATGAGARGAIASGTYAGDDLTT